jgi:triosephosphate isomerase
MSLRKKRKILVAANWKMNKTLEDATAYVEWLSVQAWGKQVEVLLHVPYLYLLPLQSIIKGSAIQLGAQNCSNFEKGAYTGEVSSAMLASVGTSSVLIGHSERRALFAETDEIILQKIKYALQNKLHVIFCCGETAQQREAGYTAEIIISQLDASLGSLSAHDFDTISIAYEPIWAIGTGLTASSKQAQEVHLLIREWLERQYGATVADETKILYGGSCNPVNAAELFSMPDIDGGLIGGASLDAAEFYKLIKIIYFIIPFIYTY